MECRTGVVIRGSKPQLGGVKKVKDAAHEVRGGRCVISSKIATSGGWGTGK